MQRVLIAGCGYVGSKLAADLATNAALEVFTVRRSVGFDSANVRCIKADLIHGSLSDLPDDVDTVFFCAAPADSSVTAYEDIYVRALGRMIQHVESRGKPGARILLTSSTSVYGQSKGEMVNEDSPTVPANQSSQVILRGEGLLRSGDSAIRLGGIYGPGRTSFIDSVRRGTIAVNPESSAFTNRIHRDDAAAILQFCAMLDRPERIYNGVDCECATRATVASWLAHRLGVPLKTTHETEVSTFLRGNKQVSNERLLRAGYQYLYPTFREGYSALTAVI